MFGQTDRQTDKAGSRGAFAPKKINDREKFLRNI